MALQNLKFLCRGRQNFKVLNHIIHMEQRIIDLLKSLKNQTEISGMLYGPGKLHKSLEDGISTFCSILSAIGTSTNKLAKFCDTLLNPITTNEYTIKDLFSFAKEIEEFDPNLIMASFDVKSLFINILLLETIGLCEENLYRNQEHIDNLSKGSFRRVLEMTMYESFFIFDQKYHKQCDGVAMGSTLGHELANFESILLENCPKIVLWIEHMWTTHFCLFVQRL